MASLLDKRGCCVWWRGLLRLAENIVGCMFSERGLLLSVTWSCAEARKGAPLVPGATSRKAVAAWDVGTQGWRWQWRGLLKDI